MKKTLFVAAGSLLLATSSAHAIDAKYREKLERSGCTQVTEMQGCDINKTKAENAKAGFVSDGGGAMAGAPSASSPEPSTSTQRIRFQRGESGAELTGTLSPGSSARYVLGAKNGQGLYVRVAPKGGARLEYQIFNPDNTFLLDAISADREYRGQLWQSGDHVVEVINHGNGTASYNLIVGID